MATHELKINPKGAILNDSANGVDHLNYSVYAKAIAERIEEAAPPITIGVFARWGGGKSHLLKHIKDLLEKKQRQNGSKTTSKRCDCFETWFSQCACRLLVMFFFVCLFTIACLWTVSPRIFLPSQHTTPKNITNATTEATPSMAHSSRYIAMGVLFVFITIVCIVSCCNESFYSARFRLILYATFTKLPIRKRKHAIVREHNYDVVDVKLNENPPVEHENDLYRYIFVNFNAWEYAGSDTLWAGIVTNLSKSIEAEFGAVTSRLFRLLSVDDIDSEKASKGEEDNRVFVHLPNIGGERVKFEEIMREYGVVKRCEKWTEGNVADYFGWWVVTYSHHKEAKHAFHSIRMRGMMTKRTKPCRGCDDVTDDNGSSEVMNESGSWESAKSQEATPLKRKKRKHVHHTFNEHKRCGLLRHFVRHFMRHPKTTCGLPNLFWWFLFYASIIAILGVTAKMADIFGWDIYRYGRAVPVVVQLVAWVPPAVAVFYVALNFVWAMFHSQRQRIQSALKGTEGNLAAQLGFMNKVKTEVKLMTQLVKCAEFTHKRRYRVVIFIDDLDRVEHSKVKSVLEAISILLSDHSSRFVCLIAVDSRVAVKSIEDSMSASLVKKHVNGHEYLKKIINLPFCLPEVSNNVKKQYICGLFTLADETRKTFTKRESATLRGMDEVDAHLPLQETNLNDDPDAIPSFSNGFVSSANVQRSAGDVLTQGTMLSPINVHEEEEEKEINHKNFAVACRKHFYSNKLLQRYLDGNLRNIKRIFNVLSLTLWVLHYQDEERNKELFLRRNSSMEFRQRRRSDFPRRSNEDDTKLRRTELLARDLVTWIVLTDQWPYRMSYLLQVIDDKKKAIDDNTMFFDVFREHVMPEMEYLDDVESLQSIDVNQTALHNFLQELKDDEKTKLNAKQAKFLKGLTINLDQSLKQTIQYERAMVSRSKQSALDDVDDDQG